MAEIYASDEDLHIMGDLVVYDPDNQNNNIQSLYMYTRRPHSEDLPQSQGYSH